MTYDPELDDAHISIIRGEGVPQGATETKKRSPQQAALIEHFDDAEVQALTALAATEQSLQWLQIINELPPEFKPLPKMLKNLITHITERKKERIGDV